MRRVGIFLFDEVEVLDFAGPFEVFSTASRVFSRSHAVAPVPFEVCTISAGSGKIQARGGLLIEPQYSFTNHPPLDVVVIPGGVVTDELENAPTLSWIAEQAQKVQLMIAICTGAFLAGQAGLLKGRRATTHWEDLPDLRSFLPDTEVLEGARWVDEGRIITSAGISAALDVSLHAVARLAGRDLAAQTARQMDYDWREVP